MSKINNKSPTFKEIYNYANSNFVHAHNLLLTPETKLNIQNEVLIQNNQRIQEQIKKSASHNGSMKQVPTISLKQQFDIVEFVNQNKIKHQSRNKFDTDRKFQQLQMSKVREDVSHYYDQLKPTTSRTERNFQIRSKRDTSNIKSNSQIKLLDMQEYHKFEESLLSEFKTLHSEGPTSRVQSIKLKEWFKKQNQDDLLSLLGVTIAELAKQIKKDCYERGALLEDVWVKIQEMISNYKFNMDIVMQKKEIHALDEYGRVHNIYKNQITSLQNEILQLKQELTESTSEQKRIAKEFHEVEENYKKSRNQLNDIRKITQYLKKKLKQSHYEIELLNRKVDSRQPQTKKLLKIESQVSIKQNSYHSDSESEQDLMDGLLDDKNIVEMDNMVMNMDKIIKVACFAQQIEDDFRIRIYRDVQTQTKINLIDQKYDQILNDQDKISLVVDQYLNRVSVEESLKLIQSKNSKPLAQRQLNLIIEQKYFQQKRIPEPESPNSPDSFTQSKKYQSSLQIEFDSQPRIIQSSRDLKNQEKQQQQSMIDFEKVKTLLLMVQSQEEKIEQLQDMIESMGQQCTHHLLQLEEAKQRSVSINTMNQFKESKKEKQIEQQRIEEYLSSSGNVSQQGSDKLISRKPKDQKKQSQAKMIFKGPQLGQKVSVVYEFQKGNAGPLLIEKIKLKQLPKIKHFMPLKLLLKQITVIYQDRIIQQKENQQIKDQDMASFVYGYFLSQFGIKKIAEQKFLILVVSVKHHKSIVRINVFAKFLGLFDQYTNYSIDEMRKYLEAFDYVINVSQLGQSIADQESEIRYMVPYLRAVQYIGMFADSRMTQDEKDELKKEVELLKELDSKKQFNIDFDQFMIQMFVKYKILVSRAKEYVINAFAACDLDGNNMCNFEEWYLLLRHIEPERLSHEQISEIFFTNADLLVKGEQNFSFEKFAVICVEYGLFSEEAQNSFIQIKGTKTELMVSFQKLIESWPTIRESIEKLFDQITLLDAEKLDHWREIIETLEQKITEVKAHMQQPGAEKKVKPLLIANILLQKEAQMLLELQNEYQDDISPQSANSIKLVHDNIIEH